MPITSLEVNSYTGGFQRFSIYVPQTSIIILRFLDQLLFRALSEGCFYILKCFFLAISVKAVED